jgi:hypothetical protein
MDRTVEQWDFKEGDQVISADDHDLGKVVRFEPDMIEPTHFILEKGLLFKHDYRVPVSAITHYGSDTVYLNLSKDAVMNSTWDAPAINVDESANTADQPW